MSTALATNPNGGPAVTDMRARPKELLRQLGTLNLQRAATQAGMGLSAFLELEDPSSQYKENDGLDAFGRCMREAGIITNSNFERGYYADRFEKFTEGTPTADRAATRALAVEWAVRTWRKVSTHRSVLTSDLEALNTSMRPYVDAAQVYAKQIQPAIPLSELVAMRTSIEGDAYRLFFMDTDVPADQRFVRVGQAAEIPRVTIKGGDHTVRLFKYGRAIEMPYELLRRQRIDKVAFWISRMAVQAEVDKVATALDVLINGDGNTATAATNYNQSTLDTGAVPTLKAYLAFRLKFTNPYMITTMIMREASALALMLLNLGSANVPLVTMQASLGIGGFTPINPELRDGIRYGVSSDAPANVVVGFDSRFALEQVTEIGADLAETERFILRQTEILALSEVEGFAILDPFATKTWSTAA